MYNLTYEKLHELVDELYDEVCICDNNFKIIYINKACQRHYGYEASKLIGKEFRTVEQNGWWDQSILPHVYKDKKPYAIKQKTYTGSELFTIAVPVFDKKGNVEYVVMSVRDSVNENILFASPHQEAIAEPKSTVNILYESEEMAQVMDLLLRVSQTDANCLFVGESGTGKTSLARYVHSLSKRKDKAFISVNCANLPKDLVESELFGYVKGAFTGAKAEGKQGLFEAANHGTILLDEISELPPLAQAKLLTVIQDKEILPIGSTTPIKIDVKIIAATNKDLVKLIDANNFRNDLYYRLNIFEVSVPPLRKRKKDITPLATFFLNKFDKEYNKSHTFSSEALQFFLNHEWKGNVRELQHVIERITVMVDDFVIYPHHLPQSFFTFINSEPVFSQLPTALDEAVEMLEKQMVTEAHQKHKSSRGVAKALNISQTRALKLIHKYVK